MLTVLIGNDTVSAAQIVPEGTIGALISLYTGILALAGPEIYWKQPQLII